MILTKEYLKYRLENYINKQEYKLLKQDESEKFMLYNGKIRPLLEAAIKKEFKKPETVTELISRLIPINIYRKVINRLAMVYLEAPVRSPRDGSEQDAELMGQYEALLRMNITGKEANRQFKSYKKTLCELYLDDRGFPRIRVLPAHTYYTFSSSAVSPEIPDEIWKVIRASSDPKEAVYHVWTALQFVICNGEGEILQDRMAAIGNPAHINIYGTLPFAYIVDSSLSTEPVPDDDLKAMSLAMPVILSDISIGCKYQAWSLIWTVGMGESELPSGPNSVVHLPFGPEGQAPSIGQVKPSLDIDGVLRFVNESLALLLSSRGLKPSAMSGQLTSENAASGIAKMIDNTELSEDRKEQQEYFVELESQIWTKLSQNMVPVWIKSGNMNQDIRRAFSPNFEPNIQLQEPRIMMSDREKIELSKMRLEAGLTTLKRELSIQYPEMTQNEIEVLALEIKEERQGGIARITAEMTDDGTEGQV